MEIQELINLVVNQGFAVAIALFSLIRLEKAMKDNTAVIQKLIAKLGADDE